MSGGRRTRLEFGSPSQIADLDHWVKAISDPDVELGDIERYARQMVGILQPALDRYREENL